jgi:predicted transcriptional regulator
MLTEVQNSLEVIKRKLEVVEKFMKLNNEYNIH